MCCIGMTKVDFFFVLGIRATEQLSGFAAVEAYMQLIIEDTKSTISPELSSVIFGLIQLPAGGVIYCE